MPDLEHNLTAENAEFFKFFSVFSVAKLECFLRYFRFRGVV
jgi:hypothetical protein